MSGNALARLLPYSHVMKPDGLLQHHARRPYHHGRNLCEHTLTLPGVQSYRSLLLTRSFLYGSKQIGNWKLLPVCDSHTVLQR
jgi:hypothetical protein